MIDAFSSPDQLRRRPAPVNTSMRRTGSGICLCSEIDMCRSPYPLRQLPFRRHTERRSADTAYSPPREGPWLALSRQLSTSQEGARSNQVSCCDGILPLRRRFGSEGPQRGPGDEVALKIERVVDGGMDTEEALRGSS